MQIDSGLENTKTSTKLREFSLLELSKPVNVLHTYMDKIRALIETQIQNGVVWAGLVSLSVSQKFTYKRKVRRYFYFLIGNLTFYPGF